MKNSPADHCTIAVVGGGTAGLALATELKRLGADHVVVLEREPQVGGIPRHCGHYPFGLREYKRLMKGPDYARRNRVAAERQGVEIRIGTTVTALHPGGGIDVLGRGGHFRLQADRVVLCTGVREASRAQRFIGGQRPAGVVSTGALQNMAYLEGIKPFQRPVILGSELVSFSAIQTCAHLGIKPVAMVEEEPRIRARTVLRPYLSVKGIPLVCGANDPKVIGRDRVEALAYIDASGHGQQISTDGIIVSGRFRPEAALLNDSHLLVDPGTGGPVVDQFSRCSDPAYFAAGNLLRPAETSGFCWHEAIKIAQHVMEDLHTGGPQGNLVPVRSMSPEIRFIVPQRLRLSGHSGPFYLGLNAQVNGALTVSAADKVLSRYPLKSRPVRRIQVKGVELAGLGSDSSICFSLTGRH